jgi:hypothetical protein
MIEGGFRHVPVVDATESVVGLLDVAKCLHDAISSVELGQLEGGHRTVSYSTCPQPHTPPSPHFHPRPLPVKPAQTPQNACRVLSRAWSWDSSRAGTEL